MTKFNYKKSRTTATKLISDFGQELILTHTEEGAYDPSTGLISSVTTTQTGNGALLDYGSNEIDGTLMQYSDKKLLLSAIALDGTDLVKPEINDTCLVGGVNYTVKSPLVEINPANTYTVLYKLNLRV